jgi:hypothetical protein
MERLNEFYSGAGMPSKDFARGLPFYGTKGDFNFTTGKSQFTPGVSIKQVPLTDMSVKGDPGLSQFDMELSKLRFYYKPGDRVRGTIVNSQLTSENGRVIIGKLDKITADYGSNSIRAWVKNPSTLESTEIYINSIERIYESVSRRALNFSQFINS